MEYIIEPQRQTKVIEKADLCVVGGSCTGVFAAVRAARLGLKVVLVEKQNMLGGTAVNGLVNIWHSFHDIYGKNQIIAGLSQETVERMKKRNAVAFSDDPNRAYTFNPWELTLTLDEYTRENKITVMFHTSYVGVSYDEKNVKAIIVENADGRGAIEAKFFIDATGDGRIARDLKIESYVHEKIQPPTYCFHMQGNTDNTDIGAMVQKYGKEFGIDDDWGWNTFVTGCDGISLRADNHVFNVRCDKAKELSFAESEGRRLADAFASMMRKYGDKKYSYALTALCSHIGIRETVHYKTRHQAKTMDLLTGKKYESPILKGTYRVDVHHSEDNGITFKYLDGTEEVIYGKSGEPIVSNWREKAGLVGKPAEFYELPLDFIKTNDYNNYVFAGRMINADPGAYGALRVMVNLNQLGEAAGVCAYLCVDGNKSMLSLEGENVAKKLRDGGSAL